MALIFFVACLVLGFATCRLVNKDTSHWQLFLLIALGSFVALETVVPSYSFAAGTEVARTGEENILAVVLGWYLKGLLVASAIYLGINLTRSDA